MLPLFWLLADEETFSSRTFSVCTVQRLIIKAYLLRHNSFAGVNCCGWAIEKWSLCGGAVPWATMPGSSTAHGSVPSSRLLPAGSVTIGIIKNWLPQTVPWLPCIIESVGNLPRVKEAERNTLWLRPHTLVPFVHIHRCTVCKCVACFTFLLIMLLCVWLLLCCVVQL